MLGKAGKAIARANTCAARLESENQRLKYQLDRTTVTRSRKRVQVNPNERYSNVEAIRLLSIGQQHYKQSRHHVQLNRKLKQQHQQQQQLSRFNPCVVSGNFKRGC